MAATDWTAVDGSLTTSDLDQGKTNLQIAPPGGNSFIYGFSSVTNKDGASALFNNGANFNPISGKGARVSGAMIRRPAAASFTGWSCFLFAGLQSDSLQADCYMLGLLDANPANIVLRKGSISEGLQTAVVGENGVLAVSNDTFFEDNWIHLRLDVVVNVNNDVRLFVKRNDLAVNDVDEPVWEDVPGMAPVFQDSFGIQTDPGLVGGFVGFGYEQRELGRTAFFDHIECARGL